MKKMSFFQIILIGVFAVGAFIGIFVFATYKGGGAADAIGPVVIWGVLPRAEVQDALTLLTQTDQSLKGVSYEEKDPNTLVADLAAAIATGSGPDLVLSSQENLGALERFVETIPLTSLSEADFTSTFIQGADVFATQGGHFAIPLLVDPLVLFYNRPMLSSSGIAKPPATWEALTGLVPSITRVTPSRQITRSFIALGSYQNIHDARGILSTLFLQTGVPISTRSASGQLVADIDGPSGEAVVGFYSQFSDPSKVSYTWNALLPDSQSAFLSGDLALYLGYGSEAKYLSAANPNLSFATALVPQRATAQTREVYGLVYGMMIPRGAKNSAGAYQVASLLVAPAAQSTIAGALGLAPAVVDSLAAAPSEPTAAVSYSEALYASGWLSPEPVSTDAVFSSMITDVTTGRSSLTSALIFAERSLGALLPQ